MQSSSAGMWVQCHGAGPRTKSRPRWPIVSRREAAAADESGAKPRPRLAVMVCERQSSTRTQAAARSGEARGGLGRTHAAWCCGGARATVVGIGMHSSWALQLGQSVTSRPVSARSRSTQDALRVPGTVDPVEES